MTTTITFSVAAHDRTHALDEVERVLKSAINSMRVEQRGLLKSPPRELWEYRVFIELEDVMAIGG